MNGQLLTKDGRPAVDDHYEAIAAKIDEQADQKEDAVRQAYKSTKG